MIVIYDRLPRRRASRRRQVGGHADHIITTRTGRITARGFRTANLRYIEEAEKERVCITGKNQGLCDASNIAC